MINNAFKSLIFGFFRKIGSILAILFILYIGAIILSKSDVDFIHNLPIGIMNVKADEFVGRYVDVWKYNNLQLSYQGSSDTFNIGFKNNQTGVNTKFFETNINVPKGSYYVYFKLYHNFRINDVPNVYLKDNLPTSLYGSNVDNSNQIFTITIFDDGGWSNCENVHSTNQIYISGELENKSFYHYGYDTFKCPVSSNANTISKLSTTYFSTVYDDYYTIGFNSNFQFLTSSGNDFVSAQNATTQAVNELNDTQQETNNKLDDIKDTLTDNTLNDDDISSELDSLNVENESLGFFSSFLTLPLTWIQNILSSSNSCNALVLPLPYVNKNLTLPCMKPFWNSLGILSSLVQACWLAVVGVRIFNGLFVLTVDTISSKPNADELTKIRSWEL